MMKMRYDRILRVAITGVAVIGMTLSTYGKDRPPETTTVPTIAMSAGNIWQSAPSDPGAFIPLIAYGDEQVIRWDGRIFAVTPLGLLEHRRYEGWRMVPELFRKKIYPVAGLGKQRWLVEVNETGKEIRVLEIGSLTLLKRLHPPIGAMILLLEHDGYWCLEQRRDVMGRPPFAGWGSIVRYSMDDKETFRFDVKPGKRDPLIPLGESGDRDNKEPEGLIYWASVEEETVWLSVIDYQGIAPHDASIYGSRKIVRIDRKTGALRSVDPPEIWQSTSMLSLSNRILWAEPSRERGGWKLMQVTKDNCAMTTLGTLDIPYVYKMWGNEEYVWILADKLRVFALKTLKEVPIDTADEAPEGALVYLRNEYSPSLNVLGGDNERIWVSADPSRVIEMRDNGTIIAYDLSRWAGSGAYLCQAVARDGYLYIYAEGSLLRLQSGSDMVRVKDLDNGSRPYVDMLTSGSTGLWVKQDNREILKLSWEMERINKIDMEEYGEHVNYARGLVCGDSCYFFAPAEKAFYRIDGRSGARTPVESWKKQVQRWCQIHCGREATEADVIRLTNPLSASVSDGARIQFLYCADEKLIRFSYDPATDKWTDEMMPETRCLPAIPIS